MKRSYIFDCVRNTLVVSKSFLDKAATYNTEEYKLFKVLREENPGMMISIKQRKAPKKSAHANLTVKAMKRYLEQARDSEARIKQLDAVVEASAGQEHPMKYTRKWFLNAYPLYNKAPRFDGDGYLIVENAEEDAAEPLEGSTP